MCERTWSQDVRWDIHVDIEITHGDARVWDKEEDCEQGVKFYEWVKELGDSIAVDQPPWTVLNLKLSSMEQMSSSMVVYVNEKDSKLKREM